MKKIDDNLLSIFNAMFKTREDWECVTEKQKSTYFFIINRNLSKKYPELSQLLNLKSIDKISAMDLWYNYILSKPYPNWFWSKSDSSMEKPKISKKDIELLVKKLELKESDIHYLVENNYEIIKEELKYWNSIENNKN
jgi:hypothetical protein